MDLDFLQLHLDNFADTWHNWHDVFTNVGGAFQGFLNVIGAFDAIGEGEGSSVLFENTNEVANETTDAPAA